MRPTSSSMAQPAGNAMLCVLLAREPAIPSVLAALLVSTQFMEPPFVSLLVLITLPTSISTLLHANSAMLFAPRALVPEALCVQVVLPVNIQWRALRPACQPAQTTQPITSWTGQSANSAIPSVQPALVLRPITATHASARRFSTHPPKTRSTALPLVEPDSTQMVQIVEVSRIETELVCATNC